MDILSLLRLHNQDGWGETVNSHEGFVTFGYYKWVDGVKTISERSVTMKQLELSIAGAEPMIIVLADKMAAFNKESNIISTATIEDALNAAHEKAEDDRRVRTDAAERAYKRAIANVDTAYRKAIDDARNIFSKETEKLMFK